MKKIAKQERSKNTTQTILEAAAQVLVHEGYARASTNRIAERAGTSVGTLYHYFSNKEDVFHELFEQIYSRLLKSIVECPPQPDLRQLLDAYNMSLLQVFNDDPEFIQSLETLSSLPFQTQRDQWREKIIDAFESLLQPHVEEITCKNLNVGARVVVCASEGLGSAANSVHFQPGGIQSHLTRLQFSYLTSTQP